MPQEWEDEKLKELLNKYTAVTIPVQVSLDAQQHIIDTQRAKEILSTADIITVQECFCRKTLANCDNPLEVCILFNESGVTALEKGARRISLEEAINVLEISHKAGLVHMAYYRKGEDLDIICSCCSCCCHHLSTLKRFGYHEKVVKSDFVVTLDESLCNECGVCVERCQVGAWNRGNGVVLDIERCFGCGLCVSTCPTGAVSLVKR